MTVDSIGALAAEDRQSDGGNVEGSTNLCQTK